MNKKMDFSLDDFKKFLREQKKINKEEMEEILEDDIIGCEVESKLSYRKLLSKISLDEGDEEEVCRDFIKEGGTISEVEDDSFLIEVHSGTFYLKQIYVRRH